MNFSFQDFSFTFITKNNYDVFWLVHGLCFLYTIIQSNCVSFKCVTKCVSPPCDVCRISFSIVLSIFTMTCRRNIDSRVKCILSESFAVCIAFHYGASHGVLTDRACVCAMCVDGKHNYSTHQLYDCRQTHNINYHYSRSLHLNSRNSHLK